MCTYISLRTASTRTSKKRPRRRPSTERTLEPFRKCLQHFDARVLLVVGSHERPWRFTRAGALEHVVRRLCVGRPLRAVAIVFGRDLVALEAGFLALIEALELFVLADRQPKFHHHDAAVVQL